MTFGDHISRVNTRAKTRLNVLRALTHSTYGYSREDISQIYKQYVRPIITYAHPAWHPDIADTHMRKIQTTENTALRIATGCTSSTPIHHLQHETRIIPLKQHMRMTGTQVFSSTQNPAHPLHHLRQPPARQPRRNPPHTTPAKYYTSSLQSIPPPTGNTSWRTQIHTTFTQQHLTTLPDNTILQAQAPHTDDALEQHIPRADRVHLSRLRCGHHTSIPSYMHRIGQLSDPTCDLCGNATGSVEHILLHCPAIQSHRDNHGIHALEHLWERPEEAIGFLRDASII